MKLAKLSYLLTVGLTLSLTAAGCRKGLDKTSNIPGRGSAAITDTAAPPRDLGQGQLLPPGTGRTGGDVTGIPGGETGGIKGAGIPQAKGDFTGWSENREEFGAQTVHFDYDKSNIKPSEISKLEEVARRMKASFAGKALRIEGHCDERGTEEYNRALGDRRALSVREKLAALGLDPEMLPPSPLVRRNLRTPATPKLLGPRTAVPS